MSDKIYLIGFLRKHGISNEQSTSFSVKVYINSLNIIYCTYVFTCARFLINLALIYNLTMRYLFSAVIDVYPSKVP